MTYTAQAVKANLPSVQVKVGRNIIDCTVSGRTNQFATVRVECGYPMWTYSWQTIADSLNSGIPLEGGSL